MNGNEQMQHDMAEYISTTDGVIQSLKTANEELTQKVATLEGTQKEASAAPAFSADSITTTVQNLAGAGFIKEAEQEACVQQLAADPQTALNFLDKLATRTMQSQVPSLGNAANKTAAAAPAGEVVRESDAAFEAHFGRLAGQL